MSIANSHIRLSKTEECWSNLVKEKAVSVSTLVGKLRGREPGPAGKFVTNNETSRRRLGNSQARIQTDGSGKL